MTRRIRKVALLGSGVMGSAVAAHLANAGIPSLVLDIVPPDAGDDPAARDRVAAEAIAALARARPSPVFTPRRLSLIETGNLEDDLPRLAEADWIIEAVKEDLGIKKKVLAAAAPHVGPDAILSSNTSGLSLTAMAAVLPPDLRPRFLGTHFFNPPRYMRLFEIIPTAGTDPEIVAFLAAFARDRLGKGIVRAKDTPNFIANRIGMHAMMTAVKVMAEMGLSIEELDALTGPAIGRPKTATFKLADLVGLDTFLYVADSLYPLLEGDEARETFVAPDWLRRMVEKGMLGRKTRKGFYQVVQKPDAGKEILALDLDSLEYRPQVKADFPEVAAARSIEDTRERLRELAWGKGRAGQAIWKMLAATFSYAAMRLGEIADDASAIDRALRWGFNWELGPFETWDALGFRRVTERLRQEQWPLPAWVDALYDAGAESLYVREGEELRAPTAEAAARAPVPLDPRRFDFELARERGAELRRNAGASLLDLGEGVLGLEFHSKMNAIGQDTIDMVMRACDEAEQGWRALVVANGAENFSVGANLMLLLMEAQEGNWEDIDLIVRAFQRATSRLERCAVPVVCAPSGLTLGGGCEVTMAGNAARAAAETYIGLVEFGAGLVPAGGGCLRLYKRQVALLPDPGDLYPAFKKAFETIGKAHVATSAEEARDVGFLRPGDGWAMNRDHLVAEARAVAVALAESGFQAPLPDPALPVMGTAGIALAEAVLFNMEEAGWVSEHDRKVGREIARVLSGGEIPGPTAVPEEHLLELERESFLRLCGERKTQERMEHLLKTGKPLRN